jgi:hypothetical protein
MWIPPANHTAPIERYVMEFRLGERWDVLDDAIPAGETDLLARDLIQVAYCINTVSYRMTGGQLPAWLVWAHALIPAKLINTPSSNTMVMTIQHYQSMWTPVRRTPHSKIMGINMELVPSSGKAFH